MRNLFSRPPFTILLMYPTFARSLVYSFAIVRYAAAQGSSVILGLVCATLKDVKLIFKHHYWITPYHTIIVYYFDYCTCVLNEVVLNMNEAQRVALLAVGQSPLRPFHLLHSAFAILKDR